MRLKLTPYTFTWAVIVATALVAVLGFHVPRLLSAQNTVLVQFGIFLIIVTVIVTGSLAIHLFTRSKKK